MSVNYEEKYAFVSSNHIQIFSSVLSLFCKVKNTNFRRRTLKNRGYAASCRIKRLEQKDELESEKGKEFEDLDKMQVEIQVTAFRFYRIKYYSTLTSTLTL